MSERKCIRCNNCQYKHTFYPPIKAIDCRFIEAPMENVPAVIPTINRYLYIVQTPIDITNGATIPASLFTDDNDEPITAFALFQPNGYTNLYINGTIQLGGIYSIHPNSLDFTPGDGILFPGIPIMIEAIGFTLA